MIFYGSYGSHPGTEYPRSTPKHIWKHLFFWNFVNEIEVYGRVGAVLQSATFDVAWDGATSLAWTTHRRQAHRRDKHNLPGHGHEGLHDQAGRISRLMVTCWVRAFKPARRMTACGALSRRCLSHLLIGRVGGSYVSSSKRYRSYGHNACPSCSDL